MTICLCHYGKVFTFLTLIVSATDKKKLPQYHIETKTHWETITNLLIGHLSLTKYLFDSPATLNTTNQIQFLICEELVVTGDAPFIVLDLESPFQGWRKWSFHCYNPIAHYESESLQDGDKWTMIVNTSSCFFAFCHKDFYVQLSWTSFYWSSHLISDPVPHPWERARISSLSAWCFL